MTCPLFVRKNLTGFFFACFTLLSLEVVAENELQVESRMHITPLVELYTSEGCSSCPPADDWLSQLGESLDNEFHAVPLAFHVDYWNYLGWNDPFSKSKYTKRQREIAAINDQRTIYTPEFVVGGKEARGSRNVVRQIEAVNQVPAKVSILLDIASHPGQEIQGSLKINNSIKRGTAHVFIAVYENNIVREIEAGENRGRTLHHDFVVRYWSKPLTILSGESEKDFTIDIEQNWKRPDLGVAVVVVDALDGTTLQAVNMPISDIFKG